MPQLSVTLLYFDLSKTALFQDKAEQRLPMCTFSRRRADPVQPSE
jgi:hypothetical protein